MVHNLTARLVARGFGAGRNVRAMEWLGSRCGALFYACWRWPLLLPASRRRQDDPLSRRAGRVPAAWPVYSLAEQPRMCVRLDRTRGLPGHAGAQPALPRPRDRPPPGDPDRRARRAARAQASAARRDRPISPLCAEYTGLGFDACTLPRHARCRPGRDSPYRAIGVYIGGLNRACSQPNLTASWVARTDRCRLASDPHLRRPAGADQQLQLLRQAEPRLGRRPGRRCGERRGRGRAGRSASAPAARSISTWRATRAPRAPAARPSRSSPPGRTRCTRRLRVRRLQQQRLGHRRPRLEVGDRLSGPRRPLDRQLERR